MFTDALSEFRADWLLAGKARSTIDGHLTLLRLLAQHDPDPDLPAARRWAASSPTLPMRRKRIQAVRAFGRWSESIGDNDFPWWQRLPVPTEPEKPQPTATLEDYNTALTRLTRPRDKAIVALLWGCGLRRAELARLATTDVNLTDGFLIVRSSKTGQPRIVPIPPAACRLVRRHLRTHTKESLFGLQPGGVCLMLRRNQLPSAHAWRRGWAVHSLRSGISEASVRSAAGWSSGAMVARYTKAMAAELALDEFQRAWSK